MLLRIADVRPTGSADGTVRQRTLLSPDRGSSRYVTIGHLEGDAGARRGPARQDREEIHYTLRGAAVYTVDGAAYPVAKDAAIALPAGTEVSVSVGAAGWECLTVTCGGCAHWQSVRRPGLSRTEVVAPAAGGAGMIRRRAHFSPVLGNSAYVTVFHTEHDGGTPGPVHVHEVHEEVLLITSGSFQLTVGGVPHLAEAGGLLYIPPAAPVSHTAGPRGCTGVSVGCTACPLGGPPDGLEDMRQLLRESHPTLHFSKRPA
jgi:quercetin dioxygenase-like cupin family protein